LGKLWSKIVFLWINFIILLKCFFDLTQSNLNIFQFCKFILIQKFNSIPMKNCFRKISHPYYTHIHTSRGGNQGTKIKFGTSKGRVFNLSDTIYPKNLWIREQKLNMGHQKAGFFNLSDTIYPKNQSFQVKNHMSFFYFSEKNT